MFRRSLLTIAALAAALGTAGCFPIVSNQDVSQNDVIGNVRVSADVCEPAFGLLLGGIFRNGIERSDAETLRAERGGIGIGDALFSCLSDERLVQARDNDRGGPVEVILTAPRQLLLSFRVPATADVPDEFQTRAKILTFDGPREQTITFRRAPEMDDQVPDSFDILPEIILSIFGDGDDLDWHLLDNGEKVASYISEQIPGALLGKLDVNARFGVPGDEFGVPYADDFNALVMAGSRLALTDEQYAQFIQNDRALERIGVSLPGGIHNPFRPGRSVECLDRDILDDAPLLRGSSDVEDLAGAAFCPQPDFSKLLAALLDEIGGINTRGDDEIETPSELDRLIRGVETDLRDLRVRGGEAFAAPGTTAVVPYTLWAEGADGGAMDVTATTNIPGVPVWNGTVEFPGTGEHPRSLGIAVPEGTTPGVYEVNLTVGNGDGHGIRHGKSLIVVLPPAAAESTSVERELVEMKENGIIALKVNCTVCGNLQADLLTMKESLETTAKGSQASKPRLVRIARKKPFTALSGSETTLRLRVSKTPRALINDGRSIKALVVIRKGATGDPEVRRITIQRAED